VLGCEGIKPGWIRVNFNYFISDVVFDYIVEAVNLVASHGWKLLPWYSLNMETATWEHVDGPGAIPLSLRDISYDDGAMHYAQRATTATEEDLAIYLDEARTLFDSIQPDAAPSQAPLDVTASFEDLRWFLLPEEVRSRE
ncbi:MAG: aminotransferase class V-fold PLP-dependent enzyme, partial [Acidimicrobiia bacterium]